MLSAASVWAETVPFELAFAKANAAFNRSGNYTRPVQWTDRVPYSTVYFYKITGCQFDRAGGKLDKVAASWVDDESGKVTINGSGIKSVDIECWALRAPIDSKLRKNCIEVVDIPIGNFVDLESNDRLVIVDEALTSHVKGSYANGDIVPLEAIVAFDYIGSPKDVLDKTFIETTLNGKRLSYKIRMPSHRLRSALLRVVLIDQKKLAESLLEEARPSQAAERLENATVWIGDSSGNRCGIGTIISPKGYLLTAGHVLDKLDEIATLRCILKDGRPFTVPNSAPVVKDFRKINPPRDLAIIQLQNAFNYSGSVDFPFIEVASPSLYKAADEVQRCVISYISSEKNWGQEALYSTLDSAEDDILQISPGSRATESGGGILDSKTGLLLGVLTEGYGSSGGASNRTQRSLGIPAYHIPPEYQGHAPNSYEQILLVLAETVSAAEFERALVLGKRHNVRVVKYRGVWKSVISASESDLPLICKAWYANHTAIHPISTTPPEYQVVNYEITLKNYARDFANAEI